VHHEIFILETFAVRCPRRHPRSTKIQRDGRYVVSNDCNIWPVCIIHTINFLDLQCVIYSFSFVSSFSSPGAGKSTISEEAIRLLSNHDELSKYHVLHLDLDVCVPQWMRVSGLKQPMQHTICRKESMNTYTGF